MSDFGITDKGFNIKRLRDIQDSIRSRLLQLKDPDTGESLEVDWDSDDPIIQIINAVCDELASLWEMSYQSYSQFNPQIASGASLSGLVQLNGILRKKGVPSSVTLQFTGDKGVLIPAGTEVTDSNAQVTWVTDTSVVIPTGGTGTTASVDVLAYSKTNGSYQYATGTINVLISSILGIQAVVNTTGTVPGVADESDTSLRLRRAKATETPSRGIAESIYGALIDLNGVTYAKVYCNRSMTADANGIPAKSIACVVQGGDNIEIAREIFRRASVACGFYGNTSVNIIDIMQNVTSVSFQRPELVPIYVRMTIGAVEGSSLASDTETQIKNNIVAYASGGVSAIGVTGSFDSFGFPPSEDVAVSRLYTPINAVAGVKVVSLEISSNGTTWGTSDISIAWDQIASFADNRITITRQE